jgi:drug/metabolite transporter (DMT)-like permease
MPFIGLLVGVALGAGTRIAESRGHRWVLLLAASAYLAVSVVGFINALDRTTAGMMTGVIAGYFGAVLVELARKRRRPAA